MSREVVLTLDPGAHCENVAGRVIAAVAAMTDLPVDRISDAQILIGAFVEEACAAGDDGLIRLRITAEDAHLGVRVGPIALEAGESLLELERDTDLGALTGALADDAAIESVDEERVLVAASFGG